MMSDGGKDKVETRRLAGRWNAFSWFGTRPLGDDGALAETLPTVSADALIAALEGVLNAAVEPRQNQQQPCSSVEFIQATDPHHPG